MNLSARALALTLLLLAGSGAAQAATDEAARQARWEELKQSVFHGKAVGDSGGRIGIEAVDRATDAAMVPVTINLAEPLRKSVRALYFIIDDNPAPVAAVFRFGPAADPASVATRVRIEDYTYMHAVAELADGELVGAARFIKAAGGCAAPAASDQEASMKRLGKMKLAFQGAAQPGSPVSTQLLIAHPNNSGMQMDQVTRNYIPADFIQNISVDYAGEKVMSIETGIAISEDPSFRFTFLPKAPGALHVEFDDSNRRHITQDWPVPPVTQ